MFGSPLNPLGFPLWPPYLGACREFSGEHLSLWGVDCGRAAPQSSRLAMEIVIRAFQTF